MGSATRYDPNAYLIVEGDLKPVRHDLLNIGLAGWNTHFSAPSPALPPKSKLRHRH
jgi:hypothetical protein